MKFIRVIGAASLFLCSGAMVALYAQRDQGDRQGSSAKQNRGGPERAQQPRQQQQQQRQAPPQRAQQPPQQRQQQRQAPLHRTEQQARTWQQQKGWLQKGGWQGRNAWEQNQARNWASDHRTWAQRGGYGGYYIPQDRFSVYFGRQHYFRLNARPVMYLGYPRFNYGGFSFLMVDPWPEYWSENWYDSDDLYIDYDDGYYLYHRRYPQVRLAITIVL